MQQISTSRQKFRSQGLGIILFLAVFVVATSSRTLAVTFSWNQSNGADFWEEATNWNPIGIPDSNEDAAIFGSVISGPQLVQLQSPRTVNTIEFNNTNSYTLELISSGMLLLDTPNAATNAEVNVLSGSHSILGASPMVTLKNSEFDIAGGSTLSLNQAALLLNSNQLTKLGNGDLRFNQTNTTADGLVLGQAGTISGSGIIPADVDNTGSVIQPGELNVDTLTVAGDFMQSNQGVLSLEFDGILPGEQDALAIQGNATLGGTLDLNFLGAQNPASGQVFDLITANSFTAGTFFDQVNGVNFGPGGFSVFFDGAKMTISAVFCDLVGDMDCSGTVDEEDVELFAWAVRDETSYLQRFWFEETDISAAPALLADMDDDGGLTFADLQPFVDEVNASSVTTNITVAQVLAMINETAIPEPSSLSLTLLLAGMLGRSRSPRWR